MPPQSRADFAHGVATTVRHGATHSVVTARIDHARGRSDLDLQASVVRAHHMIQTTLAQAPDGPRSAQRFWNFLPGNLDHTQGGLDRYSVFNAGRFAAFAQWFGDPTPRRHPVLDRDHLHRSIPTATQVGHTGDDLIIHALAAALPGRPVENPRQRSAYRYSAKQGPIAPCFARATLMPATAGVPRMLLIGSTASVCGEASMHTGDLVAQTAETFRNLDALIRAAGGSGIHALQSLRVYHAHANHRTAARQAVAEHVDPIDAAPDIDWVHASLCRADLNIAIEGVATLD